MAEKSVEGAKPEDLYKSAVAKELSGQFLRNLVQLCGGEQEALNALKFVSALNASFKAGKISEADWNRKLSGYVEQTFPQDSSAKRNLYVAVFFLTPSFSPGSTFLADKIAGVPSDIAKGALKADLQSLKPKKSE